MLLSNNGDDRRCGATDTALIGSRLLPRLNLPAAEGRDFLSDVPRSPALPLARPPAAQQPFNNKHRPKHRSRETMAQPVQAPKNPTRKILEIANAVEAVQDIHIEKISRRFCFGCAQRRPNIALALSWRSSRLAGAARERNLRPLQAGRRRSVRLTVGMANALFSISFIPWPGHGGHAGAPNQPYRLRSLSVADRPAFCESAPTNSVTLWKPMEASR